MSISLLYHDVAPAGDDDASGFAGPEAARYKLTPEEFQRHVQHIAVATSRPPLTSPVLTDQDLEQPLSWLITFDDGGCSNYSEIAGLLEQQGWRGWFFFATDFIDKPAFCSSQQIKDLSRRGHVVGSHSCSHPERISTCSWDQLVDEWTRSCRVLSDLIEQPVTTASVPGGFYSNDVARAAAQAGIKILFNSEPTTSTFRVDGMIVLGRYNIYRGMKAADAQSLLTNPIRRWKQTAFWNVKKVAKIVVGPLYKMVRRQVLTRNYADTIPSDNRR